VLNCGKEGHRLGECKKPRDNKHIDANKTAFMKLKRDPKSKKGNQESKDKGQRGKWAPPGPGESYRKQIDSKPYAFNPQTKRWDIVSTSCDPTPPMQPSPTPPQNRNDGQELVSGQLDDAMVAVTEQIGNTLWGL
jgi:hypothetical protein